MARRSTTRRLASVALLGALSALPPAPPARAGQECAREAGALPPAAAPREHAPGPDSRSAVWPAGSLAAQVRHDLLGVFTRPFELRGREWALPAALAAGGAALYAAREDVREEAQEHRSASRDEFLQDVRVTGKGAFVPGLAGILALVGAARDAPREKQTALLLIESFGASAVYTGIGSTLLAAERPADGDSVRTLRTEGHGFSLDVALSAAMIAPLDRAYFRPRSGETGARRAWRRAGRAILYLLPGLVAAQRINQDKHWAPDVYFGYATGLLVGRTLSAPYDASGLEVRVSAGGFRLRF